MGLTDTFVKQVKQVKPTGDKHSDGQGMYLLVNSAGKYWRLDYRFLGKRKTLALGVYPAVSLAKARARRLEAREQIADGIDPGAAKRDAKHAQLIAAEHTFEAVARRWLEKTASERAVATQEKVKNWLAKDLYPVIGSQPISTIKPRDVLVAVQRIEARGANESAHRVKSLCGQVFRFAVATGLTDRDVTADLKGALVSVQTNHFAAILEASVRKGSQDSFSVARRTVPAWPARQFQRGQQDSFSVASKTVSVWPARQFQRGQQDSFSVASKTVSAWPARQFQRGPHDYAKKTLKRIGCSYESCLITGDI